MAAASTEQSISAVANFLEPERAILNPVAEGRFAGAIYPDKSSFFEGIGLRIFLSYLKLAHGDYRNWDAIRAWAETTRPLLLS